MEDHWNASFLRGCPKRIETDVAGGMTLGTARRHEQCGSAHVQCFSCHGFGALEICQRDVTRCEEPRIDRAKFDHPSIVRSRGTIREIEVSGVFPVVQAPVVKSVEHQLARDADHVETSRPILGYESPRRCKVLAIHDFCSLAFAIFT